MTEQNNTISRQFGWEPLMRQNHIEKAVNFTEIKSPLFFMNEIMYLPIVKLPIELLMYRLENGRTITLQEEYKAQKNLPDNFFKVDSNSEECQRAQHEILLEMIKKSSLSDYFKREENKQIDPLICTREGFVVNGNRRLSYWRDLYYTKKTQFRHFEYVDVMVLPPCDEKAIRELESYLQTQPDIREDYYWHAEALMMKNRRDVDNHDIADIAKSHGITKNDVNLFIEMYDYADKYLKDNNRDKCWSDVTGKEYAFSQIVKERKKIKSSIEKTTFESIAQTILNNKGDIEGRIYGKIPEVRKYLPVIVKSLLEEAPITEQERNSIDTLHVLQLEGDVDDEDKELLLVSKALQKQEFGLRAIEVIEDAIEGERAKEKEFKGNGAILEYCRKANTLLNSAAASDKSSSDIKTTGIREQISEIEANLEVLRSWLASRET